MKIKMLICSLAAAAMLPVSAAEKPANYVLQEGFENVKMNNKGILYCPYIYPTTKLTEGREYNYIRGKREVGEGKFSLKMVNLQDKGVYFLMCDKVIPVCKKDEYFVLSADVRGKGVVQLALVNYTGKNKFINTTGGAPQWLCIGSNHPVTCFYSILRDFALKFSEHSLTSQVPTDLLKSPSDSAPRCVTRKL